MSVEMMDLLGSWLTFLTALIGVVVAVKKINGVHRMLNSELDLVKKLIAEASFAEGVIQGEANITNEGKVLDKDK